MLKDLIQKITHYYKHISKRFIKFGIVGVSGIIVDLGIILIFNNIFNKTATTWLVRNIVQIIGYEGSVISNYLLSFFWVWKDRQGHFLINFFKYNLATALAFLIRLFFFNLGMTIAKLFNEESMLTYYMVYFLSIGAAFVINFLVINHKVFSGEKRDGTENKHSFTNVQ